MVNSIFHDSMVLESVGSNKKISFFVLLLVIELLKIIALSIDFDILLENILYNMIIYSKLLTNTAEVTKCRDKSTLSKNDSLSTVL